MTVALPMPDMGDPAVRARMAEAIVNDGPSVERARQMLALCQAMAGNQAEAAQSLRKSLGLGDGDAQALFGRWQREADYGQFLAERDALQIKPVPYRTGAVEVRAFATKEAYDKEQDPAFTGVCRTTPSNFNDNAAIVTFNLTEIGAQLFWSALGGPSDNGDKAKDGGSSVLSATYTVTFDGLLPDASATVTLSQTKMAKLVVEEQKHRGAWGSTHTVAVPRGRSYSEMAKSSIDVVLPSADSGSKETVSKLLTDWAGKQLEDMVKSQLPALDLNALTADGVRQIEQVQDQSRTYHLSQALNIEKRPQALLPRVDAVVPADKLGDCFHTIDLNAKPFFDLDLTVSPPSAERLKALGVDRLVVTALTLAGHKLRDDARKEVSVLEFTAGGDLRSRQLRGTFSKGDERAPLKYQYRVVYQDGTPAFAASREDTENRNYLDLFGVDFGVLHATLRGQDLPWGVIDRASVALRLGDWEQEDIDLAATAPFETTVNVPLGQSSIGDLSYRLTLALTNGDTVEGDWTLVQGWRGTGAVRLASPWGGVARRVRLSLEDGADRARVRLETTLRGARPGVFRQEIELDRAAGPRSVDWTVPAGSGGPGALRVVEAEVSVGGKTSRLNVATAVLDPLPGGPVAVRVRATGVTVG
ncbi:hypothetical protein ACQ86G_26015 [Roseateles chitinivorans]|uniref:hypothetical protein n=1 Tax=Roseateles chitinivorans TaxID=2917965 RepID=UPI003D66EAA0